MADDTAAQQQAAAKAAEDRRIANEKAAADKAAANTATPTSAKGNALAPEPDREPVPTYRADMGEGLPPQKDVLNPDRAK